MNILSAAALLLAVCISAPDHVEQAWQRAVAAIGAEERSDLRMPKVIFEKPSQGLARRGGEVRGAYNYFTNTVTATDDEALVHEFCHAVLLQTEGLAAMRDEARVRGLTKAAEPAKGEE